MMKGAAAPGVVPASRVSQAPRRAFPVIEAQANEAENGRLSDRRCGRRHAQGRHLHHAVSAGGGRSGAVAVRRDDRNRTPVLRPCVGRLVRHRQQHGRHHPALDYIEDEGIKKVFAAGPDITIAGTGMAGLQARLVEGGAEQIRGNRAYGSGIQHALECAFRLGFLTDAVGKDVIMGPTTPAWKSLATDTDHQADGQLGRARPALPWQLLSAMLRGVPTFVPTHMTLSISTTDALRRGGTQGALGLAGYSAWPIPAGGRRRPLHARRTGQVIVQRRDPFGKSSDSASFRFQFAQMEMPRRCSRYRA